MIDALTYKIAKCCAPQEGDTITGYFKENGTVTVHDATCNAIQNFRTERLLDVTWDEIRTTEMPTDSVTLPPEFAELDETDYFILKHHQELGMDYSIVVAEALRIPLEETHQRHRKLRARWFETGGRTYHSLSKKYRQGEMD